jgi:hypothetical protein
LRSQGEGAGAPRSGDRRWPCRHHLRREWITASGEWINDRAHGQQFNPRFLKISAPNSIDGIEKYLGSGMICIGAVYAKKMVKALETRSSMSSRPNPIGFAR